MPAWLTEGVIIAVIGALVAGLGHAAGRASQREVARLSVLEATVRALQERVDDLEEALRRAEDARRAEAERAAEAERVQWHVVRYARDVLAWGRGVVDLLPPETITPPEPDVPAAVRDIL